MTREHDVVFLFDVDYKLLDNGHVERDLREHLSRWLSAQVRDRYFEIFEEIRHDIGYADFLGALERYRIENLHDTRVLKMSIWLVDYPFAQRLYPDSLDVDLQEEGAKSFDESWQNLLKAIEAKSKGLK